MKVPITHITSEFCVHYLKYSINTNWKPKRQTSSLFCSQRDHDGHKVTPVKTVTRTRTQTHRLILCRFHCNPDICLPWLQLSKPPWRAHSWFNASVCTYKDFCPCSRSKWEEESYPGMEDGGQPEHRSWTWDTNCSEHSLEGAQQGLETWCERQ